MPEQSVYQSPFGDASNEAAASSEQPSVATQTPPSSSSTYVSPFSYGAAKPAPTYVSPFSSDSSSTNDESASQTYVSPFADTGSRVKSGYQSPFGDSTSVQEPSAAITEPVGTKPNQDESDSNSPWYKKAWDFANHPLIDEDTMKNWFGADPDHWSGFAHGLFDVASGLTSPLSLAFAIGTFGESWGIELGSTAGVAALKTAGMGAEEVGQMVKGSQIFAKALKIGHDSEGALAEVAKAGFDPEVFQKGLTALSDAGLNSGSMISNGLVRRSGGAMLRSIPGVGIATADKIATWAAAGVDAGFSIQNLYSAAVLAPQVLDALKEGDNDKATRLAIDTFGSGAFGLLGGQAVHQHAGELMTNAEASLGLRVKPSDENLKFRKILEPTEGKFAKSLAATKKWNEDIKALFPEIGYKPDKSWVAGGSSESDLRARLFRESAPSGEERVKILQEGETLDQDQLDAAAQSAMELGSSLSYWHDAIAEVAGRPEERIWKGNFDSIWYGDEEKAVINKAIDTGTLKNAPKEYIDQLLSASDPRKMTDTEHNYHSLVGKYFDVTNVEGVKQGVLGQINDRYVSALWKKDNEMQVKDRAVRKIYDLNPSALKARTFDNTLQGLLLGYRLDNASMADLAADNRNTLSRLAVSREAVNNVRTSGVRASDGLPFVVMGGTGQVVESTGADGKPVNPATFINPRMINGQSILIDDKVIDGYKSRIIRPGTTSLPKNLQWMQDFKDLQGVDRAARAVQDSLLKDVDVDSNGSTLRTVDSDGNTIFRVEHPNHPGVTASLPSSEISSPFDVHNKLVDTLRDNNIFDVPYKKDGFNIQATTAEPEAYLTRIGDAKGVMDRHDVALEGLFKASKGVWPDNVPPVELHLSENGAVVGANGRYRAALALQNGVERIPVDVTRTVPTPKGKAPFTELDRLLQEEHIRSVKTGKTGEERYAYTGNKYRSLDVPELRDWTFTSVDSAGNPIFVKTDMLAHPEVYDYLQRRFGADDSGLGKRFPIAQKALKVSSEAKGLLLSLSPFHIVQEGLRALMTGLSPFGMAKFNPDNPMHVLAAEKGVFDFNTPQGIKEYQEGLASGGHSALVSKIPVLGALNNHMADFLFKKYIPSLKLRSFERIMAANEKLHPTWLKDKLANESADETNERFGGIPYRRMGRSAAAMDMARLVTLAPDWLESEVRFIKRAFSGDEGQLARRDLAKFALSMWGASRVLNYVYSSSTGSDDDKSAWAKTHPEAPFGLVIKDAKGSSKVYTLRTMPGDLVHAVSDPAGFLNGRMSPAARVGLQAYTGRDQFGKKVENNNIFVNVLGKVAPIPSQIPFQKATEGSDYSWPDAAYKMAGGEPYVYKTQAQKLAAQMASERADGMPIDDNKLRRHRVLLDIEDQIRSNQMSDDGINTAVQNGQLHPDEARKLMKDLASVPKGLDPEQARLYSHASKASMADLIRIFNAGTNQERSLLTPLVVKKKTQYLRDANKNMSPTERQDDRTMQWIRKNFGVE